MRTASLLKPAVVLVSLTLLASFKSFSLRLWDEQRSRLVGYRHLKTIRSQQRQTARS